MCDGDVSIEASLQVRLATWDDFELLLSWRNDPVMRKWAVNREPISREEHKKYLVNCLGSGGRLILVFSQTDRPVGTVRIDLGPTNELSWNVAPEE